MQNLSDRPQPRPGILAIDAYVPGKSAAPAGVKLHKLSSNETPLGASPAAIAAFKHSADHLELYPDAAMGSMPDALSAAQAPMKSFP